MFCFSVSVEVGAPPSRVWRALCDPAEVVVWDTGVERALDAPADYPQPGQHVRWRYSNGPFRVLHDRPQEVVPERTLRSLISNGPLRIDETYELEAVAGGGTRLTATLLLRIPWPIAGAIAERRVFGPATKHAVTASLSAIKRHCEAG
jgi:uncharacterized protein YndB with AHSA1/START domain